MKRFPLILIAAGASVFGAWTTASAQTVTAPLNGGSNPVGSSSTDATGATGTTPVTTSAGSGLSTSNGTAVAGAAGSPSPTVSVGSDYKLGVEDTISVGVTRHGDVGGTFRIPPDGLIRLPRLLTAIDVREKTATQLADQISAQLVSEGKLVLRPGQVSVVVVATRTRRIFVRGNAVHGGDYDLKNGWRVDDLISIMGSVPQADRLTVTLSSPARAVAIPINLDSALKNAASPDNALLAEGDTLTIDQPGVKRLMIKGEGPRGLHDVDERFGLRQALVSLGYSTSGASGDLKHSFLLRNARPGDATTETTKIPVDLFALLSQDTTPDIPYHDLDTLEIPISDSWVYVLGEISGPRKWYLPQDRKTYLIDVYSNAGDVTGNAKIGSIKVTRYIAATGKYKQETYDLGKFVKDADPKNNPEIFPHDTIYVPSNTHIDPVSSIFTGFSIYSILKALSPSL